MPWTRRQSLPDCADSRVQQEWVVLCGTGMQFSSPGKHKWQVAHLIMSELRTVSDSVGPGSF
jgi:hypothetical protein